MKELLLLRHAKSSWDDPTINDIDRPLNKRGKHDAVFMGNVMKQLNYIPDIIISSDAKRAFSTAKRIAAVLNYEKNKLIKDHDLYDCSLDGFLSFVNSLNDEFEKILLVGHNPEITLFTNKLCAENIINIPTCGLAVIQTRAVNWSDVFFGKAKLVSFEYPKKNYLS